MAQYQWLFHHHQVYISEKKGNRIRKIDRNGIISTIAGNGKTRYNGDDQLAVNAHLYSPEGLFVTEDEQVLIVDTCNRRVRKIDRNGIISTIAGITEGLSLVKPSSVFQYKNEIYITDTGHLRIVKMDQNGTVSTIAKVRNGVGVGFPFPVFVYNDEVYFTDGLLQMFKMQPNGNIQTLAGIENEKGFNGYQM